MLIITTEDNAVELAERYGTERCAFFSFSKSPKPVEVAGVKMSALKMPLTPDEDTINAIKAGEVSKKKTIKKIKKALEEPSQKTANISIAMCTMLQMLKAKKKEPNILFFVLDKSDAARNKLLRDIVVAAFKKFGLAPTSGGDIKSIFKPKKKFSEGKIRRRAANYEAEAKECQYSAKGIDRRDKAMLFFEIENRLAAMLAIKPGAYTPEVAKASVKALVWTYTADNLRKVSDDKFGKALAKRDKVAVKAYNIFRDIVVIAKAGDADLPKVKFGQKRDKEGNIKGPKMKKKKFKKFFSREKNWGLLQMLYAHTAVVRAGEDVGSDNYIKMMSGVCKAAGDVGEAFLKAAKKVV